MTGYLHPLYAQSLSEFGRPIELPQCGGWLLERPIPNSDLKDAMGCYPLFCCADWSRLATDIEQLKQRYVTISLVADPFAPVSASELSRCFALVQPFKQHCVISLSDGTDLHVSSHHRYYAKRALKQLAVTLLDSPQDGLDDWLRLYSILIERHRLCGIKAFSESAFATQFRIPGLTVFRASRNGRTVGMHLWYLQAGVAYSHLSAFDKEGYSLRAAYALHWCALQHFKRHSAAQLRWIDLGAAAGPTNNRADGLAVFKRGWATDEKPKYFCGSICNPEDYRLLTGATEISAGYFPKYRAGELS
jgi:GNAT acetyltransferase-like protein